YSTNDPADFDATIDWGDGTTTAGSVSTAGGGQFTVGGSHTYADEGSFTMSVTLADNAPGTSSATAVNTATISEADVLAVTATPIAATEGVALNNAQVATFTTTNTANVAGAFTAELLWGHGTSSTGPDSGANRLSAVQGT